MKTGRLAVRSVFAAGSTGHGGNRRAQQIDELLRRLDVRLDRWIDVFAGDRRTNMRRVVRGVLPHSPWVPTLDLRRFRHPRALRNAGALAEMMSGFDVEPGTIIVLDSYLRAYQPAFARLRGRGAKVVILPHNLDSLVPGITDPMSSRRAPSWLEDEVSLLKEADLLCCISREEQWLLAAHGVPSLFLPYFPPAIFRETLAEVRTTRTRSKKDKVIIAGTATNPPTLAGLQTLVEHASEIVKASEGCEVLLMGFGTEVLGSANLPAGFHVLGGVSDVAFRDALACAKVALCYQHGTSGALTRIPELLCAGVPVIANFVAARSYHDAEGVTVVEDISHLLDALSRARQVSFAAPVAPGDLEARFLSALRAL